MKRLLDQRLFLAAILFSLLALVLPSAALAQSTPPDFLMQWDGWVDGAGQFSSPREVAVGPSGDVYVTDNGNRRIQVFAPDGAYSHQWGEEGINDGQFASPRGIAAGVPISGGFLEEAFLICASSRPGGSAVNGASNEYTEVRVGAVLSAMGRMQGAI